LGRAADETIEDMHTFSFNRASSAVVIALRFGSQGPGFEHGIFHKACSCLFMVVECSEEFFYTFSFTELLHRGRRSALQMAPDHGPGRMGRAGSGCAGRQTRPPLHGGRRGTCRAGKAGPKSSVGIPPLAAVDRRLLLPLSLPSRARVAFPPRSPSHGACVADWGSKARARHQPESR
jgi:hypothetical protein